jgi:hypothetical protein
MLKRYQAPGSAFDRTWCNQMHNLRSNNSLSACEVHVALAAIANLLAPWDFKAVICNQMQRLRSNAVRVNANAYTRTHVALGCNCDRTHVRRADACRSAFECTPYLFLVL